MTESTNWRALCAELLDVIDFLCEGDTRPDSESVTRARAALAQPEPEGPTDEELRQLYCELFSLQCSPASLGAAPVRFARAVLAHLSRPAIKPVPVAERPWEREGWCDAQGKCWWWNSATNTLGTPWWSYEPWEWVEDATHCLPHHALPVPQP